MNAPFPSQPRFTTAELRPACRNTGSPTCAARLILRHAEPDRPRYLRREPALFGDPAPWLTRTDVVVDTAALR